MQGKFSFETFLDAYGSEFNEYLSSVGVVAYSESQNKKIIEELDTLYKKCPKVKDIIDMDKSHELSVEECSALVRVNNLKNELVMQEMQEVYFKGCGDCIQYLERMKLL